MWLRSLHAIWKSRVSFEESIRKVQLSLQLDAQTGGGRKGTPILVFGFLATPGCTASWPQVGLPAGGPRGVIIRPARRTSAIAGGSAAPKVLKPNTGAGSHSISKHPYFPRREIVFHSWFPSVIFKIGQVDCRLLCANGAGIACSRKIRRTARDIERVRSFVGRVLTDGPGFRSPGAEGMRFSSERVIKGCGIAGRGSGNGPYTRGHGS